MKPDHVLGMQKGDIKLKRKDKILPSRQIDLSECRLVILDDNRKTRIYVSKKDSRTDQQIKAAFG